MSGFDGLNINDGGNNINADPEFVNSSDPLNGGLVLDSTSQCIDAGDDSAVPAEVNTDIASNPRFSDIAPPDTDEGFVDMGAYEYTETLITGTEEVNNPIEIE